MRIPALLFLALLALTLTACSQTTPTHTPAPTAAPTHAPVPIATPTLVPAPTVTPVPASASASYEEYAAWVCDYRDAVFPEGLVSEYTWEGFAEHMSDRLAFIRSITPPPRFSEYHEYLELYAVDSIRFAEEQAPDEKLDIQAWSDDIELNPMEYGGFDYRQPQEVDDLYEACWCEEFADDPELQPQGEMPFEEGSIMARAYERAQYCRGVPTPTPIPTPTPPTTDRPLTVDEYLAWVCQEHMDLPRTWDGFVEFWIRHLALIEAVTPPPELREYHDHNIGLAKFTVRYTQKRVPEGTLAQEWQKFLDHLEENEELFDWPDLDESVGYETLQAHPVCSANYQ